MKESDMYKIEDGIPLPAGGRSCSGFKYPMRELKIGQSFLASTAGMSPEEAERQRRLLASHSTTAGKAVGGKFTVRAVDGGYRVWRTQ